MRRFVFFLFFAVAIVYVGLMLYFKYLKPGLLW